MTHAISSVVQFDAMSGVVQFDKYVKLPIALAYSNWATGSPTFFLKRMLESYGVDTGLLSKCLNFLNIFFY